MDNKITAKRTLCWAGHISRSWVAFLKERTLSKTWKCFRWTLLSLFLLFSWRVEAVFIGPPSSSAGVVQDQIEKEEKGQQISPDQAIPLLESDLPRDQLDFGEGKAVEIDQIQFEGNTVFTSQQLQPLIAPYTHRKLTMKDVGELCLKIQAYYVQHGYLLTRVFPPEQEIKEKTLTLHIMEGVLGKISVVGNDFYSAPFISRHFSHLLHKPIRHQDFIRALLLISSYDDIDVAAVFTKGEKVGEADVILRVADKNPRHLYLSYNNYGSSITSLHRAGARMDYGNLLFSGDMLSFGEVVGTPIEHLKFVDVNYNVPLNHRGMSLDLSCLHTAFTVQRLKSLHLHGKTTAASAELNYAWIRTTPLHVDLYTSFEYLEAKNFTSSQLVSNDALRILEGGISLDHFDRHQGRNLFDTSLKIGIPHFLGGLKAVDPLCSRVGAGGRFFFLNVDYKRLQQLPRDCFLLCHFSGQATFNKLPLSEQIYIGGSDTVRGFPLAVALGDNGYYANVELRVPPFGIAERKVPFSKKRWKEVLQFLGFIDHGGVFLNGGGEQQKHTIFLTGMGVGFQVNGPYHFNFSFDAGFPLSHDKRSSDCVLYFKISWRVF